MTIPGRSLTFVALAAALVALAVAAGGPPAGPAGFRHYREGSSLVVELPVRLGDGRHWRLRPGPDPAVSQSEPPYFRAAAGDEWTQVFRLRSLAHGHRDIAFDLHELGRAGPSDAEYVLRAWLP